MRAPIGYTDGWQKNEEILRRYQTPGTTANTTYGAISPVIDVPATVMPTRFTPAAPVLRPAPQSPAMNGGDTGGAPAQNSIQRWQAPSTDRYQARQAARGMQRNTTPGTPTNLAARAFQRIDGSAPPSSRNATMGATTPAPADNGFGATPQESADDIRRLDFGWKKPMSYGALAKKYSFPATQ